MSFVFAHAEANVTTVPDAATDDILDAAYAGWDARVYIPPPGDDPFEGVDDESLLHGHAGVMAATVMAQANQMRVLDSAIVPDRDLLRPTENPTGKFNELEVYTPITGSERYAVINEHGVEDVVTPSSPFYPGLADRPPSGQSAIQLSLEDIEGNPYAAGLATGTALLQIGIEAGKDVSAVAEILNKAWGLEAAFSPGTVAGLSGTKDYAQLYAQDRNTNARRLASWQERSYVRSGVLSMEAADWGEALHCDFRRVRVAAESMFATSMAIETAAGGKKPTGSITYHVPSTSLLSASPEYLFFSDASPDEFAKQARCAAAEELLTEVDTVGLMRALWPSTEPEIAETWAATFGNQGGLVRTPVRFEARPMTTGSLFSVATATITNRGRSFARGIGRTVMTSLSAKLASIAERAIEIQTIGWLSRFAAIVEIMRLSTSKEARIDIAVSSWRSIQGEVPRGIEQSLSKAHMRELKQHLPTKVRAKLAARSAKIPMFALLLEVGNPATKGSHTVLRGLRRAFAKSADVATASIVKERAKWRSSSRAEWLERRLGVVKEFWAQQYAALSSVVYLARHLRSDLRWWVEVSALVNTFRAGVMRGFAVADEDDAVAVTVMGIPLRLRPYHAASHLRKKLEPYYATQLPMFFSGDRISIWARHLTTFTADYTANQWENVPRVGKMKATADHTSHFSRGAYLLATDGGLGNWIEKTVGLVADDCVVLLEKYDYLKSPPAKTAAANTLPDVDDSMTRAIMAMTAVVQNAAVAVPMTEQFDVIEDSVAEEAWDDFLESAWDTAHPQHTAAARQLASARTCRDPAVAESIIRWIATHFRDETPSSNAAIR